MLSLSLSLTSLNFGAGGGVAGPSISSFSVAPQSGSNVPFSVSVANGTAPYELSIVGVPTGQTAPTASEIIAGHVSGGANAPFWVDAFVLSNDVTDQAMPFARDDPVSITVDWYAVIVDSTTAQSAVVSQTGYAIDNAPAAVGSQLIGGAVTPNPSQTSSTTQSFPYDFSSLSAGDQILICHGEDQIVLAARVNGNAATFTQGTGGSNGNRMWLYTYTLQAADVAAAATVDVDIQNADSDGYMAIFAYPGRTVISTDGDGGAQNPLTLNVTKAQSNDEVLIIGMGQQACFSGVVGAPPLSYSSAIEQYNVSPINSDIGFAFAVVPGTAVGAISETVTGNGGSTSQDRYAAAAVVWG